MENNIQSNTNKKSNSAILVVVIVLIIGVIGYGVWQSTSEKDSQQKEITTVSTSVKTTESTTESTTEPTTNTTTTKETTINHENEYYQLLTNTTWTYYFGEHDQTSILEFYDNNTLHYYHIDGELHETTSEMYGKYEINGDSFIVHNSDTDETENYTIKITISDKNNLHGMDCIKISGTGTIIPVEYYYG